jgi:hypothetical protein
MYRLTMLIMLITLKGLILLSDQLDDERNRWATRVTSFCIWLASYIWAIYTLKNNWNPTDNRGNVLAHSPKQFYVMRVIVCEIIVLLKVFFIHKMFCFQTYMNVFVCCDFPLN